MYLAFCSIVIIFNICLSSVCLMMINVFDRKLTFSFLNTSDGFLRLHPQIHTSSFSSFQKEEIPTNNKKQIRKIDVIVHNLSVSLFF